VSTVYEFQQYRKLVEENEKLRDALHFYADRENYMPKSVQQRGKERMDLPDIWHDDGEIARSALTSSE
jgi:hypothetical protein